MAYCNPQKLGSIIPSIQQITRVLVTAQISLVMVGGSCWVVGGGFG